MPAVFTVPGDALAGAAAAAVRPGRGTGLAVAASLCLYEAGMALNDWADRDEDAVARPHRPLPSGRIRPNAALAAAGGLTAAGLALAARAGRPALAVAAPLAATVWAYDLKLKHTPAGPAAMAAARSLDLLLGAAASAGTVRPALRPALLLGGHTYAVTQVSRREAEGGSTAAPLAALAATTVLAALLGRGPGPRRTQAAATTAATSASAPAPAPTALAQRSVTSAQGPSASGRTAPASAQTAPASARTPMAAAQAASASVRAMPVPAPTTSAPARTPVASGRTVPAPVQAVSALVRAGCGPQADLVGRRFGAGVRPGPPTPGPLRPGVGDLIRVGLAAAYWRGFAKPLGHAVLNPSPVLTQRAVGGGIRSMIPLQGALMAGAGAPLAGVATLVLAPVAARLARKVSTT
ncbi:SCO3242 family prenyltransferase [Streptomyces sp. NPDC086023]|uniref:SCO3242 family prenyltransferase n=1 Tax=Streptomyces sp. NPDC086023 TaxID=3365746 RepID=UPI0037D630BF